MFFTPRLSARYGVRKPFLFMLTSLFVSTFNIAHADTPPPAPYLTGPQPGKPLTIALSYLRAHVDKLGLGVSDLSDLSVSNQYTDKSTGTTHIYLQQQYMAIGVFNGITVVNVAADGSVMNVGNRFVANLGAKVRATAPGRTAGQGVKDAAKALGINLKLEPQTIEVKGGPTQGVVFDKAGISRDPIPVKLVYVPTTTGVQLAWNVTIDQTDGQHWWNANVDANSGVLLSKVDYVAHSDSYDVIPPPQESPLDGGRSIVFGFNSADALASPYGWLDSTLTVGNNVHAADDLNGDGVPDSGTEADAGGSLLFDFPLDLTQDPTSYASAAVTNLFFWNNYMHDLSYHYGFTEAAGNFQANNYGRGGLDGDSVTANDLVGYGYSHDNANFGTPPDGMPPRMQMYVWLDSTWNHDASVTVTAPAGIAGSYQAGRGAWGVGDVTASIALPTGSSIGCDPSDFTGFPAGDIALIDRGTCAFATKVRNAQTAGAVAVIVANNTSGATSMGTDHSSNQPTIPAVMVSQADGTTFKTYLPDPGVEATVSIPALPNRDGSLDNTVVAHEYTHGISTRLTGGPANVTCLYNAEQEGEGWSDFMALAVTANAAQTATTPRLLGRYATYGHGVRDFPYTTDMTINPQTYDAIKTNGEPHFVGEVWTAMLWEMYWNLVDKHGLNPNLYDSYTAGGNNLAIQLVMDGLKLQPCSPGFVDSRDAILLADQQDTGGANQCAIWRAFAKRGLGADASQGSSDSTSDGTQDFTVRAAVCGQTNPTSLASTTPPGFTATQTLDVKNPGLVGGNTLNWTITEAADNCSNPSDIGWVSESATSGITSDGSSTSVQVTFDAAGLAAGQYSGLLCISSDDKSYPTASIPISLTVPQALSGSISKSMTVASGNAVYLSPGTVVGGSVTVNAGGSLWVDNATIGGSLSSSGAGTIQLCSSTVKGSVSVSQTTGIVVFGNNDSPIACFGNFISSKAVITDNLNGVEFIGNTVKGPLMITGNSGIVDVSDNNVSGRINVQP
jgi:extracellular elastinolytic metalloproteinase